MVVLDSPFAALQLVGLMIPVVVLTLKAYVDPIREQMSTGYESTSSLSNPQKDKIERSSKIAILSLLAFVGSAFIVLVGQFTVHLVDELVILAIWTVAIGAGFLTYGFMVGVWLYELMKPEKVMVV